MNKKIIILGAILAALLMLMIPNVSAINANMVKESTETKTIGLEKLISSLPLGLRNIINRIFGIIYILMSVLIIPIAIIDLIIVIPAMLLMSFLDNNITFRELMGNYWDLMILGVADTLKLGIYLLRWGEWPENS